MKHAIYWCRSSQRVISIQEAPKSNPPGVKVWYENSKSRPQPNSFEEFVEGKQAHYVPQTFDHLCRLYESTMRKIL